MSQGTRLCQSRHEHGCPDACELTPPWHIGRAIVRAFDLIHRDMGKHEVDDFAVQAVKHMAADLLIESESALTGARSAAEAYAAGEDIAEELVEP